MKNFPDKLNQTWLIVKPLPKEEETISGIIVPETVNADLTEGRVMMRSDAIKDAINVGEVVLYPSKSGLGQIIGGEAFIWLELRQTWAVVTGKKDLSVA